MPVKPPGKPEKEEPKVEIIPGEVPQPEKPAVEVEVDAKTGQPVAASQPQVDTSFAEELKKERLRNEFLLRQFEKQNRDITEKLSRFQSIPQPTVQAEKPKVQDDEYGPETDAIAQQNWKKGVEIVADKRAEIIAEKKFKALMEEQNKRQQEAWQQQDYAMKLDRSRSNVVQRTPSLNDESSDEFKGYYNVYNQMLSEDPNLLKNPYSPEIVENRWRIMMQQPNSPEKLEADRLKRVVGGAAPQGRPISSNNSGTIRLTEDELDLCKRKGISPASYAQAKQANLKEGVTA